MKLFVISFVIISLFCFSLFRHYKKTSGEFDLISRIESEVYDIRSTIVGPSKTPTKVGILAIDEKSIKQFGRWPFSRKYYRQALNNLKKMGVSFIGFDAIFSEKENSTIDDVADSLDLSEAKKTLKVNDVKKHLINIKENSPSDEDFSTGITEFQNVVLGYLYLKHKFEVKEFGLQDRPFSGLEQMEDSEISAVVVPEDRDLNSYSRSMVAQAILSNIESINMSSSHFGFISNEPDPDGVMRWVTLVKVIDGILMPSLSLKLAAEKMDREILVIFDDRGIDSIELISREDESNAVKIPIDPLGQGRMLIKHRGPRNSFPYISLADAYHNTFSDKEKDFLPGSVLLLGATAIGINDIRANPFDSNLDGVENHAAAVDNILKTDHMVRNKGVFGLELLTLLLIGLLFVPLIIFVPILYSSIIAIGFVVGFYYVDKFYFFGEGVWNYFGLPLVELIFLFIFVAVIKNRQEEKEKKKVKGAFSQYLSPEVIEDVLKDSEKLKLGGVRKRLTVFFSDVRDFTNISEKLSPEDLCLFMNQYFTPMTRILLMKKGVLDKFIGDAIMAFWGAPLELDEQADVAADASVMMLSELVNLQRDFKERGFPHCDIGIGLNTDLVSVGNMGSDERFCYTAMGDGVNLASRLEGLTKEYGVKILISENTVNAFTKKHHVIRELDDIRVKGKDEPVKVFELLRPDYLKDEKHLKELLEIFSEARNYYKKQDWQKAKKHLNNALKIYHGDGPSQKYLKRIEELEKSNLGPDWDGVYTFKTK